MYTSAFQVWLLAGGLAGPRLLRPRPAPPPRWSAARSTCRPRICSSTAASGPGRPGVVVSSLVWRGRLARLRRGPAAAVVGVAGQRRDGLPGLLELTWRPGPRPPVRVGLARELRPALREQPPELFVDADGVQRVGGCTVTDSDDATTGITRTATGTRALSTCPERRVTWRSGERVRVVVR